jgi:hypothetical protein
MLGSLYREGAQWMPKGAPGESKLQALERTGQ